jgi:predicted ATPase/DNA-binding XRE family transcriptional regulator
VEAEESRVVGEEPLSFGQRLRQLREAAGLTQEALAERAGLSAKAISALERGRRQRPYPHTVHALADALQLAEDERAALAGTIPNRSRAVDAAQSPQLSLPAPPTPLIGRDHEVAAVSRLLTSDGARLVTMTGPGGVGKTRLAIEIASSLRETRSGRVAFVPLAPLGDPRLVLPTVAQALGLAEAGASSVREMLVTELTNYGWLLVLDNFEHVLDAAPEVADLLAACPDLAVLVTSRAPIRVRGEQEYPIRPLSLPDLSQIPLLEEVAGVSSVQLFLERARAAAPAFELTQANCAAVAAICRRLDGLPLALELAAARLRSLSPTEVLARLDRILPLLVGGARDLPQRQQTMREAINWSHELLGPVEQAVFRRLSIFASGWTIEAAEAVTAWGAIAVEAVVDLLSGLVEQSLVVVEPISDSTTRYRMLEPIRQFAASRVDEAGERVELANQHLAWCLSLAQRAAKEMLGPSQQQWLDRLEREHDDMRAALAWGVEHPLMARSGLELAIALWRFWETRGHLTEGRRWMDQVLAANEDAPASLRADALNTAGNLAYDQGDFVRASELIEASLMLRREIGDMRGIGLSLNDLGNIVLGQGYHERAATLYAEALALFREHASDWEIAIALHNTGMTLGYRGEYERAFDLLEEALAIWERIGESSLRARVIDVMGEVSRRRGDLDRAVSWHQTSLALRQQINDKRGLALTLNNLGLVARYQGDYAEATRLIEEALELRQSIGARLGIAVSLNSLADVARCQGDWPRARNLYQASISERQQLQITEGLPDSLLGVADVLRAEGQPLRAARLFGASEAVRESLGQTIPPIDRPGYDQTLAAIRDNLTLDAFDTARTAGHAMTADQAIAAALSDNSDVGGQSPPSQLRQLR